MSKEPQLISNKSTALPAKAAMNQASSAAAKIRQRSPKGRSLSGGPTTADAAPRVTRAAAAAAALPTVSHGTDSTRPKGSTHTHSGSVRHSCSLLTALVVDPCCCTHSRLSSRTNLSIQPSMGNSMNSDVHPSMGPSMDPSIDPSMISNSADSLGPSKDLSMDPSKDPSMGLSSNTHLSMGTNMDTSMGSVLHPSMDPNVHLSNHHSKKPLLKPQTESSTDPSIYRAIGGSCIAGPPTYPHAVPKQSTGLNPSSTCTRDSGLDLESPPMPNLELSSNASLDLSAANTALGCSLEPLPIPMVDPKPIWDQPIPAPMADPTACPMLEADPGALPSAVADPNPQPLTMDAASLTLNPEPATPLLRLKSFDLFLDEQVGSSPLSNCPSSQSPQSPESPLSKIIPNPLQPPADTDFRTGSLSNSWQQSRRGAYNSPHAPSANCNYTSTPTHTPTTDLNAGLTPYLVPLDCQIPGLLSDPSLDSWASSDTQHGLSSEPSQGFKRSISTDITAAWADMPTAVMLKEPSSDASRSPKQIPVGIGLPKGNDLTIRWQLPIGRGLSPSGKFKYLSKPPARTNSAMGNPIPVGNDLPRGGADPKNKIYSDMQAGYEKAQGCQCPGRSRPDACQKLCFGSLEEFLGCFPEPEPAIPPPSAPGFAIVAEPLGCGDCVMESGLSHGATVCAIVPQPVTVQEPSQEAVAIPVQQLVHNYMEACNSPVHDTAVTTSGTTTANGSPFSELAPALAESASPTAVVSMSPAVGPATPAAVQEVLYPEMQEQLHAASSVNDTEGGDTPDALSLDLCMALPCQAVPMP